MKNNKDIERASVPFSTIEVCHVLSLNPCRLQATESDLFSNSWFLTTQFDSFPVLCDPFLRK